MQCMTSKVLDWQCNLMIEIDNKAQENATTNSKCHLEELRRAKPSEPHEEPLGRGGPHARENVKYIGFGSHAFEPKNLVIMHHHCINKDTKIIISNLGIQCRPEVGNVALMLIEPPSILHVKSQSPCMIYFIQSKSKIHYWKQNNVGFKGQTISACGITMVTTNSTGYEDTLQK